MLDNPFAGQGGGFGGQSASGGQGGFRWEDIKDQFGDGEAMAMVVSASMIFFRHLAVVHVARPTGRQVANRNRAALIDLAVVLGRKIAKGKISMQRLRLIWPQSIMVMITALN